MKENCFEDVERETQNIVDSIRQFVNLNKPDAKLVIGMSGGKDSLVVAALCAKAVGPENVIGVMMPNGDQSDIGDARKAIDSLGIQKRFVNIKTAFDDIAARVQTAGEIPTILSQQAKSNLAPRLRMTTLYAVAQNEGGFVMNTGNLCEAYLGWTTIYGDLAGDFAPISHLTVKEVRAIGNNLGLPEELVNKIPSDGICGKSDEEKLGINYDDLHLAIRTPPETILEAKFSFLGSKSIRSFFDEVASRVTANRFKTQAVNVRGVDSDLNDYLIDNFGKVICGCE